MGATLELQRLQHVERLEQQMMWAQLARQTPPPAAQVCTTWLLLCEQIGFCFKFTFCVSLLSCTLLEVQQLRGQIAIFPDPLSLNTFVWGLG